MTDAGSPSAPSAANLSWALATLTQQYRVPAGFRPWSTPFPGYDDHVVDVTPDELRGGTLAALTSLGIADGESPCDVDWPARQQTAICPFEVVDGIPYHPAGRIRRVGRRLAAVTVTHAQRFYRFLPHGTPFPLGGGHYLHTVYRTATTS